MNIKRIGMIKKNSVVRFLIFIIFTGIYLYPSTYSSLKVNDVKFVFSQGKNNLKIEDLKLLSDIKPGDFYNQKKIRNSLRNLFNIGYFANIEAKIIVLSKSKLDVVFVLKNKFKIKVIKFNSVSGIDTSELKRSVLSLRENVFFEKEAIPKAIGEIKSFLNHRGYFNPDISYKLENKGLNVNIFFKIIKGDIVRLNKVFIRGKDEGILRSDNELFKLNEYQPYKFEKKINETEEILKDRGYFFPKISFKKVFLNKFKTIANVYITVNPGYKYSIRFLGIKKKFGFVTEIWKKKVFEKWAERESTVRILAYLRNKGFLNAEVKSEVKTERDTKIITFKISKKERFVLGKIEFIGNRTISSKILRNVITVDDLIFDRIFYLRINSIRVDREVLKWFYYYKGFPLVKIDTSVTFNKGRVNLKYKIDEGNRYLIDSILFKGNSAISSEKLYPLLRLKPNEPFVQRKVSEDIESLRSFYYKKGFENVQIETEISSGTEKSILINIKEGTGYKFNELIIIGASRDQNKLIKKLFPFRYGDNFDRIKIETFKREIERSSIFSDFKLKKIENNGNINILIIVDSNKSKYLGFGIGYEERTGIRFTFEYQKRNIFKSYSTFSALVQVGLKERRGQVGYETPYIFGNKVSSNIKIWEENEFYRSYKFNRYGISESLVKKLSPFSYVLSSLSWYKTKLLELNVSGGGIDTIDVPYDITALNFSYVKDKRDNPFLPTRGNFFSTDFKLAIPIFSKDYSFVRFRWGYQKNTKLFKTGIFSFSIRNGFATNNVPITERFFGGGSSTFRGTRNDKLGSLDKETAEPYGGNSLFLVNLEATFPVYIIPMEDLYYSVFLDLGNIYRFASEFSLGNLQKAIGIGLRIKSPIGLLRFDIAYNIERRENVSPIALHIGIGNVF